MMGLWDHIPAGTVSEHHTCDCCDHEASGYQMGELVVDHGWRLHSTGVGKPLFVLCGDCEARYAERWAA